MDRHAVAGHLYSRCKEFGCCHVLLDPKAGDRFADDLASLDVSVVPRQHLKDPIFAEAPEQAPLLVRVPLTELQLLDDMLFHARAEAIDPGNQPRSVCGFLHSAQPDTALLKQLSWALNAEVGGMGIYFRYFDPRVFHHLQDALPPAALGQLFRGITSWSYFTWDGSLRTLHVPHAVGPSARKFRLEPVQWERLSLVEAFSATQQLFARSGLPFVHSDTAKWLARVEAAVGQGISEPSDIAYFLACSAASGQDLVAHPDWPDAHQMISFGTPLSDALASLCGVELDGLLATRRLATSSNVA